ncbi:MAG: alternative ribosome rescue aminoacyl-tRNA hydrolase ArfB [Thermodesulfobacteriota bacterium]|nr:alternative ribosome rescue aminoacyl-tRNA hydrolase ArfB [Thermodesulfobacteriota bacterium]
MLKITDSLSIPKEELTFTASPSQGPGGQNVNKVSTKVTLRFDLIGSPSLTEAQKILIMRRLAARVNKEGELWVVSQQTRSQWANREAAMERFAELMREALRQALPRKKTRVPLAARRRRLEDKRRQSRIKRLRSKRVIED